MEPFPFSGERQGGRDAGEGEEGKEAEGGEGTGIDKGRCSGIH